MMVDRSARRWLALPAAIALLAIVALGSRSTPLTAPEGLDMGLVLTVIEVIGYVGVIVGLIGVLVGMAVYRQRRMPPPETTPARRRLPAMPLWAQLLGLLFTLGVAVAEIAVLLAYIREVLNAAGRSQPLGGTEAAPSPLAIVSDREIAALGIAVVIVLAIGVVVLAFALRWRYTDARDRSATGPAERARSRAVEVSLEALGRERDPRRAIIAAYAAMERSLARAGFGRDASEAPFEYLRRVLAGPTRSGAEVRTITDLFQVARFSHHAVDETMRTEAIRALERLRAAVGAGG